MIKCPDCNKETKITKEGKAWEHRIKVQRYRCHNCGKLFKEAK